MIDPQIAEYITTLGFPIIMCLLFYFRTEKILKSNTDALLQLKLLIKEMMIRIKK